MQTYIETLGGMISANVPEHPARARRMLTAAYSWVGFSGACTRLTDAKSAYTRMNFTRMPDESCETFFVSSSANSDR